MVQRKCQCSVKTRLAVTLGKDVSHQKAERCALVVSANTTIQHPMGIGVHSINVIWHKRNVCLSKKRTTITTTLCQKGLQTSGMN